MSRDCLMMKLIFIASAMLLTGCSCFSPKPVHRVQKSSLDLGIPKFFLPDDQKEDEPQKEPGTSDEKKIGLAGLVQLITAGAGAPFLGDYQGVDEETGNLMFQLDANNLVDEKGNSKQTQMPYFESGWVDPEDEKKAKEGFKFPWQK